MKSKLKVTPLHDRLIVEPHQAEEKTAGGIIIPDTAKEKPQRGVAIAVGTGKKDEPMTVKVGDTILYGEDRHDDTVMALGMALMATRNSR